MSRRIFAIFFIWLAITTSFAQGYWKENNFVSVDFKFLEYDGHKVAPASNEIFETFLYMDYLKENKDSIFPAPQIQGTRIFIENDQNLNLFYENILLFSDVKFLCIVTSPTVTKSVDLNYLKCLHNLEGLTLISNSIIHIDALYSLDKLFLINFNVNTSVNETILFNNFKFVKFLNIEGYNSLSYIYRKSVIQQPAISSLDILVKGKTSAIEKLVINSSGIIKFNKCGLMKVNVLKIFNNYLIDKNTQILVATAPNQLNDTLYFNNAILNSKIVFTKDSKFIKLSNVNSSYLGDFSQLIDPIPEILNKKRDSLIGSLKDCILFFNKFCPNFKPFVISDSLMFLQHNNFSSVFNSSSIYISYKSFISWLRENKVSKNFWYFLQNKIKYLQIQSDDTLNFDILNILGIIETINITSVAYTNNFVILNNLKDKILNCSIEVDRNCKLNTIIKNTHIFSKDSFYGNIEVFNLSNKLRIDNFRVARISNFKIVDYIYLSGIEKTELKNNSIIYFLISTSCKSIKCIGGFVGELSVNNLYNKNTVYLELNKILIGSFKTYYTPQIKIIGSKTEIYSTNQIVFFVKLGKRFNVNQIELNKDNIQKYLSMDNKTIRASDFVCTDSFSYIDILKSNNFSKRVIKYVHFDSFNLKRFDSINYPIPANNYYCIKLHYLAPYSFYPAVIDISRLYKLNYYFINDFNRLSNFRKISLEYGY